MALLNDEQLQRMRERKPILCTECKETLTQNYCRSCDMFFMVGHKSTCSRMDKEPYSDNHNGCRTY